MTTVTSEIDAQRAARLAEGLRAIGRKAEPALEPDELDHIDVTAAKLEEAAHVEHGERVMQSPATGETYVVQKWIDLGDAGVIALSKEPTEDGEEAER